MDTRKETDFTFDGYHLDASRRLLLKDGVPVALHAKAFDVLLALVGRHGEVITKEELLEIAWPGQFVEEGNLTVQISTLRKLFAETKNEHRFIVTVPGRGYTFVADVSHPEELVVESHRRSTIVIEENLAGNATSDVARLAAPSRTRWSRVVTVGSLVMIFAAGGLGYLLYSSTAAATKQIKTIAVMPFANETSNPDLEYLTDGITETLINSLSQLSGVSVRARASVSRFKSKELNLQQLRSDLNVEAILSGRVVQQGDHLTFFVALIDTETGNQIWGEQYERPQTEMVGLQNEIARDVSNKLRDRLSRTDQEHLAKKYTADPEAYLLYLKGRFFWNKRSPNDLKQAIEFFEQATKRDPNYALAFTGLADAYSLLSNYGGSLPHETKPKARTAALKALQLDDTLAEAHTSLGGILGDYDYDFAGEEREYKRAIELNPNYATAHHWYAELLARSGRVGDAEAEFKKALELDPLSLIINRSYAESLVYARRYDDALAQLLKMREFDPDFIGVDIDIALVNQLKGNYGEAVESHALVEEKMLGKPEYAAQMRESFARGGWEEFLKEMTGPTRPANLPYYLAATFDVARGDSDAAFGNLDQAIENREPFILNMKVDPRLDPIRGDVRFNELLKRIGLE